MKPVGIACASLASAAVPEGLGPLCCLESVERKQLRVTYSRRATLNVGEELVRQDDDARRLEVIEDGDGVGPRNLDGVEEDDALDASQMSLTLLNWKV